MADDPVVLVDMPEPHTAVLTINRPKALNALNPEVIGKLGEALDKLADEGIRHVVLTGAGADLHRPHDQGR